MACEWPRASAQLHRWRRDGETLLGHPSPRRYSPKKHAFSYKVFMPFVELETLPELTARLPLWSTKRWAPAVSCDAIFWAHPRYRWLTPFANVLKKKRGKITPGRFIYWPTGDTSAIRTTIAVYYCYDAAGEQLQYVVAEVTNTPWGERHATCSKHLMPTSLWQRSSRKRCTCHPSTNEHDLPLVQQCTGG